MFAPSKIKVGARAVALALALATSSFSAQAVLQRVGPVSTDPSMTGFPEWYQDTTGIALQFCGPKNAAELAGGWCLLLAGNVPAVPEVFPTNFFIEHFYFAASAVLISNGGARSKLIIAQEASFANGFNILPGDQVTFSRIRIVLLPIPVTGDYKFIHPYGEEVHAGVAGDRIFFTDDVGLSCKGTFTCAMNSRIGPFLLPSDSVGGLEQAALTATNPIPDANPAHFPGGILTPSAYPGTGDAYTADPVRLGPVTGSPLPNFIDSTGASRNHNIYRIEGPVGSHLGIDPATGAVVDWIETTNFNLQGRLYSGAMPGQAVVNRASYTRNATGQKVDVLATGLASTVARMPTAPIPPKVYPTLSFFDAPCSGTVDANGNIVAPFGAPTAAVLPAVLTETQMLSTNDLFWGQAGPAILPATVCVKNGNARDANGNLVPVYVPQTVTDEVTVSSAVYNPNSGTLTVAATSSDTTFPPVLSVAYGTVLAPLAGGQVVVPNVFAPPSKIVVNSTALGATQFQVTTSSASNGVAPVATNDAFTMLEDSASQILRVLQNDLNTPFGTVVTLTAAPTKGVATVNVDGTVSYTPNLNANGTDSFSYTAAVGATVSNAATATITIVPVNDSPVAVNDNVNAVTGFPLAINVLANDTDVDGFADPAMGLLYAPGLSAGAASVSAIVPSVGGTISSNVGGVVTFLATVPGTYTFTYKARDNANALSANTGTVRVVAVAPEVIILSKADFIAAKGTFQVQGSISPKLASEVVTVNFLNAAGAVIGTAGTSTALNGSINATFNVVPPALATRVQVTTPPSASAPAGSVATFPISRK